MAHGDSTAKNDLDLMLKSGQAFKFFTPFETSKAYKSTEGGDERMYIETIASSDGEDLVGDIMSLDALSQMQKTAVGVLMMRDHNPSVEKIFGTITEAELVEYEGKTFLRIKALVDEEDPQNVRIWKLIERGSKLGASVTVIITKTGSKPNKKAGLYITGVKLLEISIVSIPCNQDAWTIAATAGKALRNAEAAEVRKAMEVKQEETTVVEEKAAAESAEDVETEAGAEEPETINDAEAEKAVPFAKTVAAQAMFADLREEVEAGTATKSSADIVALAKGLFADLKEHPTFWDLIDILAACFWHYDYLVWLADYNGTADDLPEIEAGWAECLQEFAAAQADSFNFWKIADREKSASISIVDAEKAADFLAHVNELMGSVDDTQKDALREVAQKVLESAIAAGLELPTEGAPASEAEKSANTELTARAEKAEGELEAANVRIEQLTKDLGDAQEELEAAKAGIQNMTEAMKGHLRQPLRK